MTTIPNILKEARAQMDKTLESSKHEFSTIRSGKATPSMLDTVRVDMYGASMSINQVATVSTPEPRLIIVTPFDKGQMKAIEKAIRESDLGFDPAIQGAIIRIPLPLMNEQRRKDLVKIVHKLAEEGRIGIRHHRTEARERFKKLDGVSEDDVKHAEKDVQKLHDDYIAKLDAMVKVKEVEIMEV